METDISGNDEDELIPGATIVTHCIYTADLGRLVKSFDDKNDPFYEQVYGLINEIDDDGKSPLDLTAIYGRPDICQELIKRGADATAVTEKGYCSLHYAAAWGRRDTLKVLVDQGKADLQQRNVHGERPRDTALRYNQTACVHFLDWAEARAGLAEFIKASYESVTDPEKVLVKLHKEDKAQAVNACKEKTEWLERWKHGGTIEQFWEQREALQRTMAPILCKMAAALEEKCHGRGKVHSVK